MCVWRDRPPCWFVVRGGVELRNQSPSLIDSTSMASILEGFEARQEKEVKVTGGYMGGQGRGGISVGGVPPGTCESVSQSVTDR